MRDEHLCIAPAPDRAELTTGDINSEWHEICLGFVNKETLITVSQLLVGRFLCPIVDFVDQPTTFNVPTDGVCTLGVCD